MAKQKLEDKSIDELQKTRQTLKKLVWVLASLVLILFAGALGLIISSGWSSNKAPLISVFIMFCMVFFIIFGQIKKIDAELKRRAAP